MTTDRKNFIFTPRRGIMAEIEYPGIAKLVSRLVWENTTSRIKNSITGCSAVGSAPALGAGCRRFESCHSDHLSQKNRLKGGFSKKGGPSDRIRTCGILLPKQARYQLRYTRLLSLFIRLVVFSQSRRATNCATPGYFVILSGWSYSPKGARTWCYMCMNYI